MSRHFCPVYPRPGSSQTSGWRMFLRARHSWLDALHERSYAMRMGEVHLPGLDLYMVNEPSLIRRVLQEDAAAFPKSPLLAQALEPLLGRSVFTTEGPIWLRQRRMMEPAFAPTRLAKSFAHMQAAVQDMLQRLAGLPVAQAHDLEGEMTHVTADIMFRTLFSQPLASADAQHIFHAFARFQALAPRWLLPALFGLRWLSWPWERWRSRRAAHRIRGLLEAHIRPRWQSHQAGLPAQHDDILQSLLEARDIASGQPMAFDELVDQTAMLFLAGHETSASALTWALHLLAHATDVQTRARAEVDNTTPAGRPMQASDLKSMHLIRNVFLETLRLFPPVGFVARQAASGCVMRNKQVAAGATVVVSPWLMHRHRGLWDDPDAFNPDRFDDEASRELLRQAYLPFGLGPRVCMGAAFARQEATLVLASVLQHFELSPTPGHVPWPVGRLTVRPANGMRLQLRPREVR